MVLKNKILISAPADAIWGHLVEPARYQAWNRRARTIVPVSQGAMEAGYRYRIRHALATGESNFLAEVIECEPLRRLVIHLTGGNLRKKGYGLEVYELETGTRGTLLRQTYEIHGAARNPLARMSIAALHHLRIVSDRKSLRTLREIVEQQSVLAPAGSTSDAAM